MNYTTLSAYSINNGNLEISLVISDLIAASISEAVTYSGYTTGDINKDHMYFNSSSVPAALEIAGLKVPNYYYYRWCMEHIVEENG